MAVPMGCVCEEHLHCCFGVCFGMARHLTLLKEWGTSLIELQHVELCCQECWLENTAS